MKYLLALLLCSSVAFAQLPVHPGSTMQRNTTFLLDSTTTPYAVHIGLYQNDSAKLWLYRTIANDGYDWSLRSRDKGKFSTSISSGLQSVSKGNDSTYAWLRVNGSGQIVGDVRRIPGGTAFSQAIFADYDSILFAIAGTERFRLISTGASITGTLGLTGLATFSNNLYLGTASSHTGVMRFYSDDDAYYQSFSRATGFSANRNISLPDLDGTAAVSGASQPVSFGAIQASGNIEANGDTISTDADLSIKAAGGDMTFKGEIAEGSGLRFQTDSSTGNNSYRIFMAEDAANLFGFSHIFAGAANPSFGGTAFTLSTNTYYFIRHDNSATGSTVFSVGRGANDVTFSGGTSSTTGTFTTGLSTFNGTNAGSATLGAGDSIQVTVTGFTATGIVMATYTSNTALTTAEIPLAIGNKQTNKFTIFGSNGETVDYFVSKK